MNDFWMSCSEQTRHSLGNSTRFSMFDKVLNNGGQTIRIILAFLEILLESGPVMVTGLRKKVDCAQGLKDIDVKVLLGLASRLGISITNPSGGEIKKGDTDMCFERTGDPDLSITDFGGETKGNAILWIIGLLVPLLDQNHKLDPQTITVRGSTNCDGFDDPSAPSLADLKVMIDSGFFAAVGINLKVVDAREASPKDQFFGYVTVVASYIVGFTPGEDIDLRVLDLPGHLRFHAQDMMIQLCLSRGFPIKIVSEKRSDHSLILATCFDLPVEYFGGPEGDIVVVETRPITRNDLLRQDENNMVFGSRKKDKALEPALLADLSKAAVHDRRFKILIDLLVSEQINVKFFDGEDGVIGLRFSAHGDHNLMRLANECGFPRGYPGVWIPNVFIHLFGFRAKFANDNRQETLDMSKLTGDVTALEKWSGFLGQLCVFTDPRTGKIYWFVASKNYLGVDNFYVQVGNQIMASHMTAPVLARLAATNTHVCFEMMSVLDQGHGFGYKGTFAVVTATGMGSVVGFSADGTPTVTSGDSFVQFNSIVETIAFAKELGFHVGSAYVIPEEHTRVVLDALNAARDFMTTSQVKKVLLKFVADGKVHLIEGNIAYDDVVAGPVMEGLILLGCAGTVKFKFPWYILVTDPNGGLRQLIKLLAEGGLTPLAAKELIKAVVRKWVIDSAAYPKFEAVLMAAFIEATKEDATTDDRVARHIRIWQPLVESAMMKGFDWSSFIASNEHRFSELMADVPVWSGPLYIIGMSAPAKALFGGRIPAVHGKGRASGQCLRFDAKFPSRDAACAIFVGSPNGQMLVRAKENCPCLVLPKGSTLEQLEAAILEMVQKSPDDDRITALETSAGVLQDDVKQLQARLDAAKLRLSTLGSGPARVSPVADPTATSVKTTVLKLKALFLKGKGGKAIVETLRSLTVDQVAELKEQLLPQVEAFIAKAAAGNYKGPPNLSVTLPLATGDAYELAPALAIVIAGTSGSGKSTVAQLLAKRGGKIWIEQDFFDRDPHVFHGLLELLHLFGINVVIARMSLNDNHIKRIVDIYGLSNVTVFRPDETQFIAGALGQLNRPNDSRLWQVTAAHAQKRGGMMEAPLSVHTVIIKLATVDCVLLVRDVQNILSQIKVIGDWTLDISPDTPPDHFEKQFLQLDWSLFTKNRKDPEKLAAEIVALCTSGAQGEVAQPPPPQRFMDYARFEISELPLPASVKPPASWIRPPGNGHVTFWHPASGNRKPDVIIDGKPVPRGTTVRVCISGFIVTPTHLIAVVAEIMDDETGTKVTWDGMEPHALHVTIAWAPGHKPVEAKAITMAWNEYNMIPLVPVPSAGAFGLWVDAVYK